MQRSIADGWDEFERGHDAEARRIFESLLQTDQNSTQARLGLAQLALRAGEIAVAEQHVRQGLAVKRSPELLITMGQVLGAQGSRREAEATLDEVVRHQPDNALARAILAEQIVRQGRWEDGTNQFIAALSQDKDGQAFSYFTNVVAALIDAFLSGRMPEKTATQFLNRVDYGTPKTNPSAGYFFGAARRAITGRQKLEVQPFRGWPESRSRAAQSQNSTQSSGSNQARGSNQTRSSNQARNSNQARSSNRQNVSNQARTSNRDQSAADNRRREQLARLREARQAQQRQSSEAAQPQVDANQKDIKALIRRDRDLNNDLLKGIPELEPAKWPSEANYDKIDTVAPVELGRDSLLGVSSNIDTRDFRVTTGNLDAEIFLERCVRHLMIAMQQTKIVPLVGRPGSVWQMELNCRDGLLRAVTPPNELYRDVEGFDDYAALSLGFFLGNIPATLYGGAWTFEKPTRESFLEIGDVILRPFETVFEWLNASDKDDVHLGVMMRLAKQATQRSTSMIYARDYIDPTAGLTDEAIATTLATLWTSYRFSLPEAAVTDISGTLKLEHVSKHAIVFTMPKKWAPEYAKGPGGAALIDEKRVALAYIRESGEFVALASRKALAHLIEASFDELDEDASDFATKILALFHRPGWAIAHDARAAQQLAGQFGNEIAPPTVRRYHGRSHLQVFGVSQQGPCRWILEYDPDGLIRWQLDFKQL